VVKFESGPPNTKVTSVTANKGADKSREVHQYSDVDLEVNSQHHTLGPGPTQAAAGTHTHEYAGLDHDHTFDDLPEIVIPDEVIVQPTDPTLDGDVEEGTVWIDTSIPDAAIQYLTAIWETDPYDVTVTTFAHPSTWGNPIFTAPADGVLEVDVFCDFDNSGLLNSREAQWRLRIYDAAGTFVSGNTVVDARARTFTQFNKCSGPVLEGETYTVKLEFALSHANGTTFTVEGPKAFIKFIPFAEYDTVTIETDP